MCIRDSYYVATFVVKDSSGIAVSGAKINVFTDSDEENPLAELTTDSSGRAEEHFAEGTYDYSVTADGFKEDNGVLEIDGGEKEEVVTLVPANTLTISQQPSDTTAGEDVYKRQGNQRAAWFRHPSACLLYTSRCV